MINIFLLNIVSWLEAHELPCLIKKTFHIQCPGCGLQRSFIALLQGNVLQSLHFYPALLPLIILICCIFINRKWHVPFLEKCVKFGVPFVFAIIVLSYIYKLTF